MYEYSYWRSRPTERDFSLDIISRHPEFDGRKLKKFALDGIETIGVWGDEPFEINFHNTSYEDVQVRVSLDGTDVMTGKPADLEINHAMWLVKAGRTLHLRAWYESQNGGARLVFTGADKRVALHTHGDMSHKGIISVAVFTETDRPRHVERPWRDGFGSRRGSPSAYLTKGGGTIGATFNATFNAPTAAGEHTLSNDISDAVSGAAASSETMSYDSFYGTDAAPMKSLKKEAAVGAGEFVSQKTHTVRGLEKPILNSVLRVRYMWWDDVVARLKSSRHTDPYPTGFPADKIKSFADLSGVPRIESTAASRTEGIYTAGSTPSRTELEPIFDRLY